MITTATQFRSFNRPAQLLMINQLTINIGFYMLMPYLAGYLSQDLGLAAWTVGLVLGMRNLSQQGLFLLGGSLADRVGYKPMILAGLALRVLGFALLAFATSLPTLLLASALTGMAGALFNPAVRAYLSHEAGHRKVEAFATFNVFYQAGILLGPLLGIAVLGFSFRMVCLVAAVLFAALFLAQSLALPARRGPTATPALGAGSDPAGGRSMLGDWRVVVGNRPFLLFSLAMIGSYVLNFQVYLGLPLEVRRATGGTGGVTALFVLSGILTVCGQVRLTMWVKKRWTPAQALQRGLTLMSLAFVPLALSTALPTAAGAGDRSWWTYAAAIAPVLASTSILTVATMVVYPFEMATIVELSGGTMVATYYGLYNTLAGVGIAVGNLLTGAALDAGRSHGLPALPWIALTGTGLLCAGAITALHRTNHLAPPEPGPHPTADPTTGPTTRPAPSASMSTGAVTVQSTTPR